MTWSIPTQTTEHTNLQPDGIAEVCRTLEVHLVNCRSPIARLPLPRPSRNPNAQQKTASYTDEIPTNSAPSPDSFFTYGVTVVNHYGKGAGISNQVRVSAAPTLPPPANFRAQLTAQGVQLSWDGVSAPTISGVSFRYRIYRQEAGSNKGVIAGELPVGAEAAPNQLDRAFEWEKTYEYHADVVTTVASQNGPEQQVEGDDTPAVEVVAHDVFPPAAPSGLQAVFSGPGQKAFIDLIWTPGTEADLAGYNIYRQESNGNRKKLNSDLIKAPAFRDDAVAPGARYIYSVSAVDVHGNESSRSEEVGETVPQ